MKTLRIILAITTTLIVIAYAGKANAQMSEYKFKQQFDKAFEHTLNGENKEAISILRSLHNDDKEHAQVTYLLALNDIRDGGVNHRSGRLLSEIVNKVSIYHQVGRVEDRTAPVKAWYYLAKSYEKTGQYDKAISAYRNYMSNIQLASLDHKREIVQSIKALRAKKADAEAGVSNELASKKP